MTGFSSYSITESRERTEQVNKIIRDLEIRSVVDIADIDIERR